MSIKTLIQKVEQLSEDDRETLMQVLLQMKGERSGDLTSQQSADLQKRIAEDDAGLSRSRPWAEVREALQEEVLDARNRNHRSSKP